MERTHIYDQLLHNPIMEKDYYSCKGVVTFDKKNLSWSIIAIKTSNDSVLSACERSLFNEIDTETIKIIGNIYDNPEMLTKDVK